MIPSDVDGAAEQGSPYVGVMPILARPRQQPSRIFHPVSCEQAMVAASRRGLGMARTLCPDRERASIAVVAALIPYSSSSVAQIGAQGAR